MVKRYETDVCDAVWADRAAPAAGQAGWSAALEQRSRGDQRDFLSAPHRLPVAVAASLLPAMEHGPPLLRLLKRDG